MKVVMTDKGREAVDLAWEQEKAVANIISSLSKQERDFAIDRDKYRTRITDCEIKSDLIINPNRVTIFI